MNHQIFDAITRRAALSALGGAGVAALAAPASVRGKKRRNGKEKKGNANTLCQKQAGQCTSFITAACGDNPRCLAFTLPCCPLLGSCDTAGFLRCRFLA